MVCRFRMQACHDRQVFRSALGSIWECSIFTMQLMWVASTDKSATHTPGHPAVWQQPPAAVPTAAHRGRRSRRLAAAAPAKPNAWSPADSITPACVLLDPHQSHCLSWLAQNAAESRRLESWNSQKSPGVAAAAEAPQRHPPCSAPVPAAAARSGREWASAAAHFAARWARRPGAELPGAAAPQGSTGRCRRWVLPRLPLQHSLAGACCPTAVHAPRLADAALLDPAGRCPRRQQRAGHVQHLQQKEAHCQAAAPHAPQPAAAGPRSPARRRHRRSGRSSRCRGVASCQPAGAAAQAAAGALTLGC